MKPAARQPPRPTLANFAAGPKAPYLEASTTVRVRFSEVDALQIVWHGHYVSYLEEARRAFGRCYGIDYSVFLENRVAVPVVQLHLDYLAPARLTDVLEIRAQLLKSEAAKLIFDYWIHREGHKGLLASGRTVQVFTTPAGELLLTWPRFMQDRFVAWEKLWKYPSSVDASPPSGASH